MDNVRCTQLGHNCLFTQFIHSHQKDIYQQVAQIKS